MSVGEPLMSEGYFNSLSQIGNCYMETRSPFFRVCMSQGKRGQERFRTAGMSTLPMRNRQIRRVFAMVSVSI